ncbi:MAG: hypothetical protein ABJA81_02630 [Nocardioidaceae bacterium]
MSEVPRATNHDVRLVESRLLTDLMMAATATDQLSQEDIDTALGIADDPDRKENSSSLKLGRGLSKWWPRIRG